MSDRASSPNLIENGLNGLKSLIGGGRDNYPLISGTNGKHRLLKCFPTFNCLVTWRTKQTMIVLVSLTSALAYEFELQRSNLCASNDGIERDRAQSQRLACTESFTSSNEIKGLLSVAFDVEATATDLIPYKDRHLSASPATPPAFPEFFMPKSTSRLLCLERFFTKNKIPLRKIDTFYFFSFFFFTHVISRCDIYIHTNVYM